MAIQRLTLTQIRNELLRIVGNYASSADADWATDANLYRIINAYGAQVPRKALKIAGIQPGQRAGLSIYRTIVNSATTGAWFVVAAGSATIYCPEDMDQLIGLYDRTNERKLDIVDDVSRWHIDTLRKKPAGPPEAVELLDVVVISSIYRRQGTIHPPTASGVTPSFEGTYFRLPAIMAGTDPDNEYVDCETKYQYLWLYGPAAELLRPNNPSYDRYKTEELELLTALASTAQIVA